MARERRIITFGPAATDGNHPAGPEPDDFRARETEAATEDAASAQAYPPSDWDYEAPEASRSTGATALGLLAILLVVAWTAFSVWAHRDSTSFDPPLIASLIAEWAAPVLLVAVCWLLVMRNSRREAARFGHTASQLSHAARDLEVRLATVNGELSLAREFIAAQSRDLESLGRVATERLSQTAERLQELIRDNGAQVESIGSVSRTALENMETLRGQLPVIANTARDVTSNIGNAGRTAHAQIEELAADFGKLSSFGQANEQQVHSLRATIQETLTQLVRQCDEIDAHARNRFGLLNDRAEVVRTELARYETEAMTALSARTDEISREIERLGGVLGEREAEALQALDSRLASLRDGGNRVSNALRESEARALSAYEESIERFAADHVNLSASIDAGQTEALEALRKRFDHLRSESNAIGEAMDARTVAYAECLDDLRGRTEREQAALAEQLAERLDAISLKLEERARNIGAGIDDTVAAVDRSLAECANATRQSHENALAGFTRHIEALDAEALQRADTLHANLTDKVEAVRREHELSLAQLTEHLASFGNAAQEQSRELHDELSARQEGLKAARSRFADELQRQFERIDASLADRGKLLSEELEQRQERFLASEQEAVERMAAVLSRIDSSLAERFAAHDEQAEALASRAKSVTDELGAFSDQLDQIAARSAAAEANMSQSLQTLVDRIGSAQMSLSSAGGDVDRLSQASARLLETIELSNSVTSEALPETLARTEERIAQLSGGVSELKQALTETAREGDALIGGIGTSNESLRSLLSDLETAQAAISDRGTALAETYQSLKSSLDELDVTSSLAAQKARDELSGAINELAVSARSAIADLETEGTARVSVLAETIGTESAAAIDRAILGRTNEIYEQVQEAVVLASEAGSAASNQLGEEIAKVVELVDNLEGRIEHARRRAEEQVDNDFARRVALITESLNSNAIDISKALATDIPDTAWAAYLKGDRGIFTRRAVRLLETSEAKAIHQAFDRDDTFRDNVSRYIHDFEAILREVLSTRDGNALGVTLLTSDMGKLYVALAQGIERLRS